MLLSAAALRAIFDALPDPVFLMDHEIRILAWNRAAQGLVRGTAGVLLRRRAGEALACLHAARHPQGCGASSACRTCEIRAVVGDACGSGSRVRRRAVLLRVFDDTTEEGVFLVTAAPLPGEKDRVVVILEDITELDNLQRIIPICMHCKKIRNDAEYWEQVESYFNRHLDVRFSHGLCPECLARYYQE